MFRDFLKLFVGDFKRMKDNCHNYACYNPNVHLTEIEILSLRDKTR